VRFLLSWGVAVGLVAMGLPKVVGTTWRGIWPVFGLLTWTTLLGLTALWFVGLVVHTFVLTAAAPRLSHCRALTLNLTGSAVANVVPLGGAAGVELNRRMMKDWGLDARTFTGFTFLTNVWDVGAKLLLPVIAVLALGHTGGGVTAPLRTTAVAAGMAFAGFAILAALLVLSPRGAAILGTAAERVLRSGLRLIGRDRELGLADHLLEIRLECAQLVARGWLQMSLGIGAYLALQCALLGWCLHVAGAGSPWTVVLAGFAVERVLTVLPITPGGVGVADIGLVGVLLALGGDPTGVTAGAVLFRAFVFAVEIPVGGSALGLWLLARRRATRQRTRWRSARAAALSLHAHGLGDGPRVAHVTDCFLPRLGGIEMHVDDLARHQRAAGLDAHVLTPAGRSGSSADPPWLRRLPLRQARHAVLEYDAVHVHVSMLSPYGVRVARAAVRAGLPTLVTVHSMWAGVAAAFLRLAALADLRGWPIVWSAVSGAAASSFARVVGTDVAVLPNAVDVAAWRPDARAAAPRPAPDLAEPVTVISVMRLAPRKRPMQLLRVFAAARRRVPALRLVVVGDGPMRHRLERYATRHGLADVVRFTGRLPRERVREELAAASLYVSPAPQESFGIAALEARCAGLPVLAHRRSGVGEFITDRVDGVLVDGAPSLAAALAELATDEALRARITAHNRRVPPHHDWSHALEQTAALYRDAARAAGPTTADPIDAWVADPAPLPAEA
jgi:glycosyltransferase involved in cell wall biosynthesis/uncharacterized membrane protein YbhN (UPF0104 family)